MNLTEDLVNLSVEMESKMPEDVKILMEQAAIELIESEIVDFALQAGDIIPNFFYPMRLVNLLRFKIF
jgi:hypothetical protein